MLRRRNLNAALRLRDDHRIKRAHVPVRVIDAHQNLALVWTQGAGPCAFIVRPRGTQGLALLAVDPRKDLDSALGSLKRPVHLAFDA